MRVFILLLLFSGVAGCSDSSKPPPPAKELEYPPSVHITHILKYLNKQNPQERWEFYQRTKRRIPDGKERYIIYAFISKESKKSESLLVVGKNRYARGAVPVHTMVRLRGIVDEMNIVRLGADPRTHLLLASTHFNRDGVVYSRTAFWDCREGELKSLWGITSSYDREYRETYSPPEFHYWDGNDDGVREIILTNTWEDKKKPPKWKQRWAVFRWNPKKRAIVPTRGLLLNRYKDQNPLWLAFAAVEAGVLRREMIARQLFKSHAICDSPSTMIETLQFKKWHITKPPELEERHDKYAKVHMDLRAKGVGYRMVFELNGKRNLDMEKWLICHIHLYKRETRSPFRAKVMTPKRRK